MKLFTANDARAKASNALKKHEAEILQQILETIKAESEYSCVISEPFPFSIKIVNKLKKLGIVFIFQKPMSVIIGDLHRLERMPNTAFRGKLAFN